jgi:hypothetical protein
MIKKVLLETNALPSLGPRLENVEFATLLAFREFSNFELLVPETSWKEYLRHRKKELSDCLGRNKQNRGMLEKHGHNFDSLDLIHKQITESLANLEQRYNEKAKAIGIAVVPIPPIDVNLLLEMSLAGEPPFECAENEAGEKTKEKGFRDAAIMFTILESIRGQDDVVIVTADGPLKRGIEQRANEYNTKLLVVAKIADAVGLVGERLGQWYRKIKKQETRDAIALLLQHRKEIVASVAEVRKLSEADLGQSHLSVALYGVQDGEERKQLDIESVLSLDFKTVDNAVWKDRDKAVSRILFNISCTARVLASPRPPWSSLFPTPIFLVGQEKQQQRLGNLAFLAGRSEHELPVQLYGEARFERVGDEDWGLTSLKVEKSVSEEWIESMIV